MNKQATGWENIDTKLFWTKDQYSRNKELQHHNKKTIFNYLNGQSS